MTREERLASKRESQRKRRERAVAAGKCRVCCRRKRTKKFTHCRWCRAYGRRHRLESGRVYPNNQHVSSADRFLLCCLAHGKHRAGCSELVTLQRAA